MTTALADLDARAATVRTITVAEKRAMLRQRAEQMRALLADGVVTKPEVARQQIGEILDGRILVTPDEDGRGATLEGGIDLFSGPGVTEGRPRIGPPYPPFCVAYRQRSTTARRVAAAL